MSRKGLSCLSCKDARKRPKYVERLPSVVFYPPIGMPGRPTIEGTRMNAELVADIVYDMGVAELHRGWPHVTREGMLVACWWAGMYGPRKWRKRWGEWAEMAGHHLWHSCVNVPGPPVEQEERP